MKGGGRSLRDPLRLGDGSSAAPTYSFASMPTYGVFGRSGALAISLNGNEEIAFVAGTATVLANTHFLGWSSTTLSTGSADVKLVRDAANVLALKNGTTSQAFRIYATTTGPVHLTLTPGTTSTINNTATGGVLSLQANAVDLLVLSALSAGFGLGHANGQFMTLVSNTELTTIASAATTDTTISVPAGSILLAVSVRVTVSIPTAATFTVTTTVGGTALNTAAVSTAANSTDPGTAAGASYRAAATQIRITPNATPAANTGRVRVTYYALQVTPPTS